MVLQTTRNVIRLFRIIYVLAHHGVLFPLERVNIVRDFVYIFEFFFRKSYRVTRPLGQRLVNALTDLGPIFVKLGQALSTRPDLIGEEIATSLAELQDKLPPFPFTQVKQILEEEFEQPITDIYRSFDTIPVAAASIAQVHFAVTTDGKEVAVKILRPDIREAFHRDIDVFCWLAELIEHAQPNARRLKPVEAVKTFAQTVEMEMDLRFEAAAAAEFADNFADDPTVRIPTVDWQRTSQRVLTVERVYGIAIDERDVITRAGIKPNDIVGKAANAFFNMVFRDGFFHGDLHPGNMFVGQNGEVILVDFGITGRVDHQTRRFLGEMLIGFLTADYRKVAEIHFEAGYVPADRSIDAFTQACRSVTAPIFGRPMNEISIGRLLGHMLKVTETFGMETQPQLLLLQKTMITAEGIGRLLAPEVNMWILARPLIEEWIQKTLGPEARLKQAATNILRSFEKLPKLLSYPGKVVTLFDDEGMRLHPDTLAELSKRESSKTVTTILPWMLVAILTFLLFIR